MFLAYALLYSALAVPMLVTYLSWHYTGGVTVCWKLRLTELATLLLDVWMFALAIGFCGLCIAYTLSVGISYWDFTHERSPVTEQYVRHLVFEINSLIFVVPFIGVGAYLSWWRWHPLRVFFGLERGKSFQHEV
ncbi:MAG: hypothetical protein KBA75_05200 [Alphaproteobacteria bacterium]|nr:hypothetical protein [Alphaproteobacteria bacterium]